MDKFIVRSPAFSLDLLVKLYEAADPVEFIFTFFSKSDIFQQSIYLYSKELFAAALQQIQHATPVKKREGIALSLIKYYKRCCYRCTPFGVSSEITVGYFGTQNSYKLKGHRVGVKLDGYVLNAILEEVGKWSEIRDNLYYYPNNTLYSYKKAIRYVDRSLKNNAFKFDICTIESSVYVRKLIQLAKKGARRKALTEAIEDFGFTTDEALEFTDYLIDENILRNSISYQATNPLFEEKLLSCLKDAAILSGSSRCQGLIDILVAYQAARDQYTDAFAAQAPALAYLQQIDAILKPFNFNTNKASVQVDAYGTGTLGLPKMLLDKCQAQLESLIYLNNGVTRTPELEAFRHQFNEKYGLALVPLLEALDPQIGIGYNNPVAPPYLLAQIGSVSTVVKQEVPFTEWDRFVLAKYNDCLTRHQERKGIIIRSSDLETFSWQSPPNRAYGSAVVGCRLIAGHEQDVITGDFLLDLCYLKQGSAADTFSRFAYNSPDIQALCQELVAVELDQASSGTVTAELVHLAQPRLSNILNRSALHKYEIPIYDAGSQSGTTSIALSDLYICIRNEKLLIVSKSLKKVVVPLLTSAHNHALMTMSVYNFLGSLQQKRFVTAWSWGPLNALPYLPRVTYQNLILSKAKWRLVSSAFASGNSIDIPRLCTYISDNKIDRYVTLHTQENSDNILPLDLHNSASLTILSKELAGNASVVLCEDPSSLASNMIYSNVNGKVSVELHIPFHPVVKATNNGPVLPTWKKADFKRVGHPGISATSLLPGFTCQYLKLYASPELLESLLALKFLPWLTKLQKNNVISHYFFIRYVDPDFHIRLRLFGNPIDLNALFESFEASFTEEILSGKLAKLQVDTYEREVDRYANMVLSEQVFYRDSQCALKLLKYIHKLQESNLKWLYALAGVHYILNDFNFVLPERKELLESIRDFYLSQQDQASITQVRRNTSNFYRSHKGEIVELLSCAKTSYVFLHETFKERSNHLAPLVAELRSEAVVSNVKSFIHMSLNRLFDSHANEQETIIYDLLLLFYRSISHTKDVDVI
ncbi:hypothetical protein GCM10027594_11490 [Hymenobacter agri]